MESGRKRSKNTALTEEQKEKRRASQKKWRDANKERVHIRAWRRYHEKKNAGTLQKKPLTEAQKLKARERAKEWYLRFREDKKRLNRSYYYKHQYPDEPEEAPRPPAPRIEKPADQKGVTLGEYFCTSFSVKQS